MRRLAAMIAFPNAKINLGLHVLGKRTDGFHDIETVMVPVGWSDAVEVVPLPSGVPAAGGLAFSVSGLRVPAGGDNLCGRAVEAVRSMTSLPPLAMHLHKVIPSGAGLGGGSSDAAHVLGLLKTVFALPLDAAAMDSLAAGLGSDCPFFLRHGPCLAQGRGERLTPVAVGLVGLHVVIVKPECSVSTAEAYGFVVPRMRETPVAAVVSLPPERWRESLINDFEAPVFARHPEIAAVRDTLYELGAVYASLSGSGSAVYGLFRSPVAMPSAWRNLTCWQGPAA